MARVNIKGLNKAELLVALYNGSHQQGMGVLQPNKILTNEEAETLLKTQTYFDYLYGRVLKIDLSGDELETDGYNRDIGSGIAESIIATLKEKSNVNFSEESNIESSSIIKNAKEREKELSRLKRQKKILEFRQKMLNISQKTMGIFTSILSTPIFFTKSIWTFVKHHWPEIAIATALIHGWGALNSGDTFRPDTAEVTLVEETTTEINANGDIVNESVEVLTDGISYESSMPIGRISTRHNKSYYDRDENVTVYGKWIDNADGTYSRTIEKYSTINIDIDIQQIIDFINNNSELTISDIYKNVQIMQETKSVEDIDPEELNSNGIIKVIKYDESEDKTITVTQTVEENTIANIVHITMLSIISIFTFLIRSMARKIESFDKEAEDWKETIRCFSNAYNWPENITKEAFKILHAKQAEIENIIDSITVEQGNMLTSESQKRLRRSR